MQMRLSRSRTNGFLVGAFLLFVAASADAGTTWTELGLAAGPPISGLNSDVEALQVSGNTLYAGGAFTNIGGVQASHVAQWNGTNWAPLGSGVNGFVYALTTYNSNLVAAGTFSQAGGNVVNNIALWDGTNWSPLGSGFNNFVVALAVGNGRIYAAGAFLTGTNGTNYVAQWDGTNWTPLGTDSALSSPTVQVLLFTNGTLYLGGAFSSIGGVATENIAQWNGSSWSPVGTGIGAAWVEALAAGGGKLYAGGEFEGCVAQWDGTNWSALGTSLRYSPLFQSPPPYVAALAVEGGVLYAGGLFSTTPDSAETNAANYIAQWDGANWSKVGQGISNVVYALAETGNVLYEGGTSEENPSSSVGPVAMANLPVPLQILNDADFGFQNGAFGFDVLGPYGSNVVIQSSPDLQNWTPLQTNQLGPGPLYFSDPQSTTKAQSFYRLQSVNP